MPTATIRLPVCSALVQARPYPIHGVEIFAQVRLDTLADALNAMEHDDTDPGERPMNADQCRDALLRELLGGWSPSELVEARIPGVLQMADEIATLRREMDEARAEQLRFLDFLAGAYADDCPAHELVKRMSPDVLALFAKDALALGYLADAIKLGVEWERGHRMAKDHRDQITTPTPGAQP